MFHKTNADGYKKDTDSNVIVNTNEQELLAYKNSIAKLKQSKMICDEIDDLKRQLIELRTLFQEHLNGKTHG